MELLIRLGLAILIIAALLTLYFIWTRLHLFRLRRKVARRKVYAGLENLRVDAPAVLYFTTPDCIPCHTLQAPAIDVLLKQYGGQLQVIKIDAAERPDLADYWGVLSVPTTFIIDREGRPRGINHGVASAAKLRQQLRDFGGIADTLQVPAKEAAAHGEVLERVEEE
jgi:thioredoxin-like negative regulator of GroEL